MPPTQQSLHPPHQASLPAGLHATNPLLAAIETLPADHTPAYPPATWRDPTMVIWPMGHSSATYDLFSCEHALMLPAGWVTKPLTTYVTMNNS